MAVNFWSETRRPRAKSSGSEAPTNDHDPNGVRSLFQQDYDRLLFSTPVRRLADKTQVWPMDENDGVRTRLTHSHEVANLARSIGTRAYRRADEAFSGASLSDTIQPMLSAIGLAHDLGNPPFGHQGETAIGNWFKARKGWIFTKSYDKSKNLPTQIPESIWPEFTKFDGNPQSLRLLAKLQTHHARLGLDLTAATLAATLKYPVHVTGVDKEKSHIKKYGYFESEKEIVGWIRKETGLDEKQRHPLTWIMEACDDIAYSVLDVDDLLKKGLLSPDDVIISLQHNRKIANRDVIKKIDEKFKEVNDSNRCIEIRHDIKIQFLRAYVIESLINDASDAFVENVDQIMNLSHESPLMDNNPVCDALKDIAKQYGLRHPSVLRTEAVGAVAIDGIMSSLWEAISEREADDLKSIRNSARSRYIFSLISPNYLEEAEEAKSLSGIAGNLRYRELRLLTDMVSGMTDTYATKLWQDISTVPHVRCP
ncbi:dGTP triphosphohydrolase [Azospirillum thiophilum]|uniref:dGTP triphosphohydrolase n=1 Tax=Azospirillum thiophilum TaxID=528244 RepID=UPI0009E19931|nr:dNTP triphosphohydrolase [Azospirillum thiophilum]